MREKSCTPTYGVCMISPMSKKRELPTRARASDFLSKLPNPFTASEALSTGIPSSTFYRLAQQGDFYPIARGLYVRKQEKSTLDLDMAEIASKAPTSTICLTSALAEHSLTDMIPKRLHIAIPRGTWAPKTMAAITWHRFDPDTFTLGRSERKIDGTNLAIGIYSPERTLADIARHPRMEHTELVEGIRRWLRKPGNHPASLLKIARQLPGARRAIQTILEILI